MAWRLAIDFGTSNTAAAIDVQGAIRPIGLSDSGITMPSAVVLTPSGFRVGEEAINAQLRHPDGFERTPKTLVGRGEVVLAGQIVTPDQIVTEVYQYVRAAALRRQNNEAPTEVWLTHPVAWAPSQVESLRNAAAAAGFDPETIQTVPEPIAAAAHYARNHQAAPGSRVAVFDFGGGTLDIAVLERAPHLPIGYKVLAYGGDPVLGGRTFDARLLDWTLETLARRGHNELAERLHRPKTMAELRAQTALSRAVTAAKTELSTRPDADISVSLGDEDAVVTITRSEYEQLIADDIQRAAKLLTDVFDRVSGASPEVLYLTGGSSRTPAISQMIRERSNIEIATLDDPKLVVAEGALHVGTNAAAAGRPMPARQMPERGHAPRPNASAATTAAAPNSTQPLGPSTQQGRPPVPQPFAAVGGGGSGFTGGERPAASGRADDHRANERGFSDPNSGRFPVASAADAAPAKKKSRKGLIIGAAIAALLLVGGGIWGATALFNNGGPSGNGGPTDEPATDVAIDVPTGSIDCWDGSKAASGANCPPLEGEAGLNYVVKVSGASCTPTTLEGATAEECVWYDRPNTHLFIMQFDDPAAAVTYGDDAYGNGGQTWKVNGETSGTMWEGSFDAGNGGYSHYYVYADQPYAVFLRLDNDANGNHESKNDVEGRFKPKPLSEVAYAVATTKRV